MQLSIIRSVVQLTHVCFFSTGVTYASHHRAHTHVILDFIQIPNAEFVVALQAANPLTLAAAKLVVDAKPNLSIKMLSALKSAAPLRNLWANVELASSKSLSSGSEAIETLVKKTLEEFPKEALEAKKTNGLQGMMELLASKDTIWNLQQFCLSKTRIDEIIAVSPDQAEAIGNANVPEVMALTDSLQGFFVLHAAEVMDVLQKQFAARSKSADTDGGKNDLESMPAILRNLASMLSMLKA